MIYKLKLIFDFIIPIYFDASIITLIFIAACDPNVSLSWEKLREKNGSKGTIIVTIIL